MTFCCIKCSAEFTADQSTSTAAICDACEAAIALSTRQINSCLETYALRSRKSYHGLNIEMIAALFDALDNMGGWEAEKAVARIIGSADTEDWE